MSDTTLINPPEHVVAAFERMIDILEEIDDVVSQQQVLELLLARHVMRCGNAFDACRILEGVAKHVKQTVCGNVEMLADGGHRRPR